MHLPWPLDAHAGTPDATRVDVPASNFVLDLHGSPHDPQLVLFMAGNQLPALPDLRDAFAAETGLQRVFMATLPPGRLIDAMVSGRLVLGNLVLDIGTGALWPDAFMAGARELQRLQALELLAPQAPLPYARNRGMALLVRAGNPLQLRTVADLLRPDVRLAISSPEREPASFASYADTLRAQGGDTLVAALLAKPTTLSPRHVHHREVPQLLADGLADAAPLYLHLARYLVQAAPALFDLVLLPDEGNARDALSIALLRQPQRPAAAAAWRNFLCSAAAAAVFAQHGLDGLQSARMPTERASPS
jgi:ABC-type molybdate transport system substrate-binding protein